MKSARAGKLVYYSLDDAHISLLVQVGLTHLGHGAPFREGAPVVGAASERVR